MSEDVQPPKPADPSVWSRICSDKRVAAGLDFLAGLLINVVVVSVAVLILAAGAYTIALTIHIFSRLLEGKKPDLKIEVPSWAHNAEVLFTGLTIVIFLCLACALVGKDAWRVTFRREEKPEPLEETKQETKQETKPAAGPVKKSGRKTP